ncbi:MAG: S46 family peptidase [Chitinophagaceae bacterium]|nr:S46 family peptidase [Chitinophagaceae bacterium]
MKRLFLSLTLVVSLFRSYADEGMWLPMLLGKQVYNDMVKRGLKLSKEQLYSVNKASIKDAIIIFGGFCTGEIVSNQGLIFTNHHCGYDVIASASSVDKNYLRDGFYAKSREEEIPAASVYAEFLLRIEDVTKQVEDSIGNLTGAERAQRAAQVIAALNAKMSDPGKSIATRISAVFKGNQFLAFVYQRYNDVRLVGAPPESVGKYGGDTDNWEWPRHTGDFSVFRAYMSKDGKPAQYSTENIPLKPKYFLPVSIKGIRDGDYAMIYGYPGSTNRYETSYGVKQKIDITNPSLVSLRDMRLKYMFAEMTKDPAIKLKLASDYANIANYWKFFDGETKQLIKYHVYDQKVAQEEKFMTWAKGKPEFENIFTDLAKAYDAWRPYVKHQVYINEGIFGSPLIAFAASLQQVENAIVKSGKSADISKAIEAANEQRSEFIKSEHVPSDQKILAAVLYKFYNDIDKSQHPIGFYEGIKGTFGDLNDTATYAKYAANVFSNTMLLDSVKWNAFAKNPDGNTLQSDPAYATASAFVKNFQGKYLPMLQQFNARNNEAGRLYIKGSMLMDTAKARKMYPDATFTMRVSFGNVKSYVPRDAMRYNYQTTMKGVLEKYKPGDYEFDLPEKFLELARKKDYGQYADKTANDLVVGFITTNDITGGNSGSPVIDANGNLIGLAFDGNYEALSHKIAFDKDLNRSICVDVRYVLWCIDKLGGAGNIIRELKLVRQ